MQHFVAVVLKLTTVCRINIRLIIHIYIQDFFTDYGRAKIFSYYISSQRNLF